MPEPGSRLEDEPNILPDEEKVDDAFLPVYEKDEREVKKEHGAPPDQERKEEL